MLIRLMSQPLARKEVTVGNNRSVGIAPLLQMLPVTP
jgi:hypothetical protein